MLLVTDCYEKCTNILCVHTNKNHLIIDVLPVFYGLYVILDDC